MDIVHGRLRENVKVKVTKDSIGVVQSASGDGKVDVQFTVSVKDRAKTIVVKFGSETQQWLLAVRGRL